MKARLLMLLACVCVPLSLVGLFAETECEIKHITPAIPSCSDTDVYDDVSYGLTVTDPGLGCSECTVRVQASYTDGGHNQGGECRAGVFHNCLGNQTTIKACAGGTWTFGPTTTNTSCQPACPNSQSHDFSIALCSDCFNCIINQFPTSPGSLLWVFVDCDRC